MATAGPGSEGHPLKPGTPIHITSILAANTVAVIVIVVTGVAVVTFADVFVIARPGVGRIAGGAGDAGMSANEGTILPGTALPGWLLDLKGLHNEPGWERGWWHGW